ncbi:MAG: PAS domain S-box protein [Methanoregula sp.]|jgi:PAS domain S-box-containing protein|nr:PAS domain S-box protein [Methanoregula sp.]
MADVIRILYVDDELGLLELGKLFLEVGGVFAVDTLSSAQKALNRLDTASYDAIISDYMMPEMDGIQFLKALRAAGNPIPFIIFTGKGREEVVINALNSGADFYLQKGGDPTSQFAELKNYIGKAIRQKSADEALKVSEIKYRDILENIQDVYYRCNTEGNLILASPSMVSVLGYDSLSELYGKNIARTFYHNPEQRTQFISDINRSGSVTNYEVTLKKRDGTPVFVLTSSHKYYDQSGNFQGIEGIFRDITERKKAENELRAAYEQLSAFDEEMQAQFVELKYGQEALRTSEKKLQGIVQGSPIPQFVIDKDHRVISWNSALERYSGVKADEVLGTSQQWRAFYTQERPCMADLLVDGTVDTIPGWYAGKYSKSRYVEGAYEATDFFKNMGANGIWLYFTASALRDSQGNIIGAVETLEDITDIKKAEEEIQSMSRFQQGIIANANVWLMALDNQGTILLWNNAAEEISGYSAQEVVGNNRIWALIYPDKEYRKTITRILIQIISERKFLQNFETTIHTKSGDKKTILWNTRGIGEDEDRMVNFVAIGIDITKSILAERALRDSENKLSAIVRSSPIPQFVIDQDHKVIQWNEALEKYSGIRAQEVLGTSQQWRAFYPQERPCMADLLAEGQIEKIPQWYSGKYTKSPLIEGAYEATDFFPHMSKSGTWLHFTAAPIRDVKGAVIGAVETLEDITERKNSEEGLYQANKKLNLLNSITRHDMLNQLVSLQGYLQLSRAQPQSADIGGYLEKCSRVADTLERQISFTRDYQDLGVKTPDWQNVKGVVKKNTDTISAGDIRITDDCAGVEVYADPLFEKVFYNLIDNALKYGGKTLTTIRFSCHESDKGLSIVCEDDGEGLCPEDKTHLFEQGFGKNTGLGLFLSREILSITGITITADDMPGTGARFEMTVPKGAWRNAGERG